MRIALTGASSTGKTTLCQEILSLYPKLRTINVDARDLIAAQGCANVGDMNVDQYKQFQTIYIERKLELERAEFNYITERSFVDAFVYWQQHCAINSTNTENSRIRDLCKLWASRYDLHIFLPFEQIPFTPDGYRHRSLDYHRKISHDIQGILQEWGLKHIECTSADLEIRVLDCQRAIDNRVA